jgi:DNA-binding NtrC family response regulator
VTQFGSAVLVATSTPSSAVALDDDIRLAARVDVPVLITAKSHDQRNDCARVIHATGANARGPFVPFWSGGIKVGADDPVAVVRTLRHQFDQARGGTLFIDDIAALPDVAQWELFTLLNDCALSCARPNGAENRRAVRIISGASRHMAVEHATRPFCAPLFYRLNVLHLDLITDHGRQAAVMDC